MINQSGLLPIFEKYNVVNIIDTDMYSCADGSILRCYMDKDSILVSVNGSIAEHFVNGQFEPCTIKWKQKEVYFRVPLVNAIKDHMSNRLRPILQSVLDREISNLIGYRGVYHLGSSGWNMLLLTADEKGTMVLRVVRHVNMEVLLDVKVEHTSIKLEWIAVMNKLVDWELHEQTVR